MSSKKMFYLLIVCLVLLAGAGIGSVVYGNGLLKQSASKLNELKLETNVIDEQQNSLAQAKQDIDKYRELESIAKSVVPQEKDQARTVREIVRFAQESGVAITNVSFPASELGNDATTAPAAKGALSCPVTQAVLVEGVKGVCQLEIAIQNDKDTQTRFTFLMNFLRRLEQNRRTSQVTNVDIQPDPANRNLLTYSMTINVYIKP